MFGSLDYIYVPASDVDGEAQRYVETLGTELIWKVRRTEPPRPVCGSVSWDRDPALRPPARHECNPRYRVQD